MLAFQQGYLSRKNLAYFSVTWLELAVLFGQGFTQHLVSQENATLPIAWADLGGERGSRGGRGPHFRLGLGFSGTMS